MLRWRVPSTMSLFRRRRTRLRDFSCIMWLPPAFGRRTRPVPLTRKRLAALLLVFILGMVPVLSAPIEARDGSRLTGLSDAGRGNLVERGREVNHFVGDFAGPRRRFRSMSSTSAVSFWYSMSAILSGFLSFGMSVAFLIGAFVVRKTRPDAFGLLIASTSIHLGNLFLSNGLYIGLPAMVHSGGHAAPEDLARAMFFAHVLTTLVSLTANGLLLAGILRLAKGPQMGNPFAEGRYQ